MQSTTLKFTTFLFLILNFLFLIINAQTPNQFKYQAVLRDASGNVLSDKAVTIDISILQGSATGTSVFDETHNVTTTAQGLINLNIGSVQDMSTINWSTDTYFMEITVNGTIMGTSQLLSVPYALHAETAKTADYNNLTNQPNLFSGSFADLNNVPTTITGYGITDAFSGNYDDLSSKPNIIDSINTHGLMAIIIAWLIHLPM